MTEPQGLENAISGMDMLSIGGDNTPSPQLQPEPIQDRLPPAVLSCLLDHLLSDAITENSSPDHTVCERTCPDHMTPWTKDLTNLSMSCSYVREYVWRARVRKIVIAVDEDFGALEKGVAAKYRDAVRDLIIQMPWCDCPNHYRRIMPRSLGSKFARYLNAFLATCTGLEAILDYNNGTYHGLRDLEGPSLTHPTVKDLQIGFPFLTIGSGKPLNQAFPALEILHLFEKDVYLFGSWNRLQFPHPDVVLPKDVDYKVYLEKAIGKGGLPGVRHLRLNLTLPHEVSDKSTVAASYDTIFDHLHPYLPNVQKLEILIDAPYTQDRMLACAIPIILYKLGKAKWPLQDISMLVKFDWRRLNSANMLHESWKSTSLEELLPTNEVLTGALRKFSFDCLSLTHFALGHIQPFDGKAAIVKLLGIQMQPHTHGCGAKYSEAVIIEDYMDRDILRKMNFRYRNMITENRERCFTSELCDPPSLHDLSQPQPYKNDDSEVPYDVGADWEDGPVGMTGQSAFFDRRHLSNRGEREERYYGEHDGEAKLPLWADFSDLRW